MDTKRRIGVFGGSFDPVHQAHIALAGTAMQSLQLDQLHWVPVGHAWHKARKLADGLHRAEMIRLALADSGADARQQLDTIELERAGPSYTVQTLDALQARQPGCDWFLVIGQDQYASFHGWSEWRRLLTLCTLAVAARAGDVVLPPAELAAQPHRMQRLPLPAMQVSSTDVRSAIAQGRPPEALVPGLLTPSVARYIARHALYALPTT
ncbi:MAG: nicotinate (nicotinamide) nucleotide adenylyltransferase [Aquabacterium sp.]|jgi:nicotinate-nucleotide adenylyltransferase|nr:MAG: nicotinate (nicotinamide) nucleotide adenylyltransferase [Aquabacterium sp.]